MPLQNFCKYTIFNSLNHILKVGKFVDGFNEFVRGLVLGSFLTILDRLMVKNGGL